MWQRWPAAALAQEVLSPYIAAITWSSGKHPVTERRSCSRLRYKKVTEMTGRNELQRRGAAAVADRDTVAGCEARAAEDRLLAGNGGTENIRRQLERSAASWDARAGEIQKVDDASANQRIADSALWASEEEDDVAPPA